MTVNTSDISNRDEVKDGLKEIEKVDFFLTSYLLTKIVKFMECIILKAVKWFFHGLKYIIIIYE